MPRTGKEFFLLLTTAICIGIALWSGKNILTTQTIDLAHDYRLLILPISALLLGGAFFILSSILIKNAWFAYGALLIIFGLPYSVAGFTRITAGFILITALLLAWTLFQIRRAYFRSPSFQLTPLSAIGLPTYFTVASLALTAFYVTGLSQETAFQALFPQPVINVVFNSLGNNIGSFIGMPSLHFNPNDTVDKTIEIIINEEAQKQGLSLEALSPTLRTQALAEQRRALSAQLGIALQGNQKIADVFNKIMRDRVTRILGPYQSYLPFIAALIFFLTLKTISIPLYYGTILITFLLIKLLVALTILKRETEQIPAERIALS